MPTKKKTSPARKAASRAPKAASSFSAMASAQLKDLRKTVDQLKARLAKETKARGATALVAAEAKKAREALMGEMRSLKDQGSRLTKELKKALGDAEKRETARQQAIAKINELRAELAHRTDELKRKSEELAKLAKESASRAKGIIMGEGAAPSTKETGTVTTETEAPKESHTESSIER